MSVKLNDGVLTSLTRILVVLTYRDRYSSAQRHYVDTAAEEMQTT